MGHVIGGVGHVLVLMSYPDCFSENTCCVIGGEMGHVIGGEWVTCLYSCPILIASRNTWHVIGGEVDHVIGGVGHVLVLMSYPDRFSEHLLCDWWRDRSRDWWGGSRACTHVLS